MAEQVKPDGRRWVRVVLFVSLALNLAVAGAVVGHFVGNGPQGPRDRRTGDDPVIPYTRAFNPEQRRDLGRSLRNSFDRKHSKPGSLTAEYRAALDVLRAEPFDPASLQAILQAQAARADMRRNVGQSVLAAYLASLDSAERHAYADRLEQQIQQMTERRKRWRQD